MPIPATSGRVGRLSTLRMVHGMLLTCDCAAYGASTPSHRAPTRAATSLSEPCGSVESARRAEQWRAVAAGLPWRPADAFRMERRHRDADGTGRRVPRTGISIRRGYRSFAWLEDRGRHVE